MMQVQDLRLKKDVLPFFNHTINDKAEARLLTLLQTIPDTLAAVLERQTIIKGIMANWAILEYFTYRRLDALEVHDYFNSILDRGSATGNGKLRASIKLLLSATERNRLRSKYVQLILLLNGIQKQYLGRINTAVFPDNFKSQLQLALTFLDKLKLETNANLVNENCFNVSEITAFTQLLNQLNPSEIKSFWDFFFTFEAYWSVAKATLMHDFTFPEFNEDTFSIEDFYHPIVKSPVKNTLVLGLEKNVLLLTGPNMSGKSTLLKAIGLCVYLAHAGFPLPAAGCTIPYFNSIAIGINLNDNLRDGYSHFMAEIGNLKEVVRSTENSQRCFAVFDEIFRGTNVDDALDITQTTINGLAKIKGSYFLISTHLLQLEDQLHKNSSESIKQCFIECVLDNDVPKFSYKLKEGWSQLKIGRILFEQVGLSEMLGKQKLWVKN